MLLVWLRKIYRRYKLKRLLRELIMEVDELETKVRKHNV
jgi:hypothetical protein